MATKTNEHTELDAALLAHIRAFPRATTSALYMDPEVWALSGPNRVWDKPLREAIIRARLTSLRMRGLIEKRAPKSSEPAGLSSTTKGWYIVGKAS